MRCGWCSNDSIYQEYHDKEWGVPVHNDQKLFEMLCLEGAQAGLSWITILKRRKAYQKAFHQFDISACANMTDQELESLCSNDQIIRHKLKIFSVRKNARAALDVQEDVGSLDHFLWSFVEGQPMINHWNSYREAPTSTPQSDTMSKALKKRGFSFVGSTICYAFMQAVGMVDDHELSCDSRAKRSHDI